MGVACFLNDFVKVPNKIINNLSAFLIRGPYFGKNRAYILQIVLYSTFRLGVLTLY